MWKGVYTLHPPCLFLHRVLNLRLLLLSQFYEQFDDDEIGALDNAELEGFIEPDSARLEEVIKDYFIQKEKEWDN